jgi:hypothetical protein
MDQRIPRFVRSGNVTAVHEVDSNVFLLEVLVEIFEA